MSSEKYISIAPYINLPEKTEDWYNFLDMLAIHPDEFSFSHEQVLITNKARLNLYNEDDQQVLNFNDVDREKSKKEFFNIHKESIEKLEKHFRQELPVQFGLVSYYR